MVAEGKENEDFVYDLYDNHVCITKYKGNDASLKIPAEIEGLPVTRLKGQPKEAVVGSTVTSVELPDTVTIIDDYAFYKASIQTITLPASLTSIRWHAFMYCKDLENVQPTAGQAQIHSQRSVFRMPQGLWRKIGNTGRN